MNHLNSVLVEGVLAEDPNLSYTEQGTACVNFNVACHRYYREDDEYREETSFFETIVRGRKAEVCAEYLRKGRAVRVVGRLKQERMEDGSQSRIIINAEHVEFGPEKSKQDGV